MDDCKNHIDEYQRYFNNLRAGDKVMVKDSLVYGDDDYNCTVDIDNVGITPDMASKAGKFVEISGIFDRRRFSIVEDSWSWSVFFIDIRYDNTGNLSWYR